MRYLIIDAEMGLTMCDTIPTEALGAAHEAIISIVDTEYDREFVAGQWMEIETI